MIDTFLNIEKKYDLYNKEIEGFHYWNYIRTPIYQEMEDKINNNGESFPNTKIDIKDIPKRIKQVIFDRKFDYKQFGKCDILFSCHPRRILVNDEYESVYTDVYSNAFDRSITIERPYLGKHYMPAVTNKICYLDKMFYLREIKLKISNQRIDVIYKKQIQDVLRKVNTELFEVYNYSFDEQALFSKIVYFFYRYKYTKKYFSNLLKRTCPKVIVEVVSYNFENLVLTECARKEGIPVIEMQHGLTGKGHIAYNYCSNVNIDSFPDYFFAFSDYWKNNMRLPSRVEIFSIGFNYYERMLKQFPKKKHGNLIVFLSSGSIGVELSKFAVALQSLLANSEEYKIVYKLHPGEYDGWEKRYPILKNTKIEVIDSPNTNLYELFSAAVAQVGVYSTALFEGMGYNINTYILNNNNMKHVDDLIRIGAAYIINTPEELINHLKLGTAVQDVSSKMWQKNAYDNFMKTYKKILAKS